MDTDDFTHIVVGAGSAGCVVAAQICEDRESRVLLIEAGPDYSVDNDDQSSSIRDARRVPMRGQFVKPNEAIDWNMRMELTDAKFSNVAQAKLVGGGSSINGGTALRSTASDSQEWVALGNATWGFGEVTKVYDDLEAGRRQGSPLPHPLMRTPYDQAGKIQRAFVDASLNFGIPWTNDLNAPGSEGVGASPVCRSGNRRISAADTFLAPFRGRNLTVWPDTAVARIKFSGRQAVGVVLANNRVVVAMHGVILAAGALHSPTILQRSGIGPAPLLRSLDIPILEDLPSGECMSDHPMLPIVALPHPGAFDEQDFSLQMQARWSSSIKPKATDLQMVFFSYILRPGEPDEASHRSVVAGVGCNVNKPESMGSVHIVSKAATEHPRVRLRYFETATDLACGREAVRKAFQLMESPEVKSVLGKPLELDPATVQDDHSLNEWIKAHVTSTYHFTGSCRMATRGEGGVVDQRGSVYGTRNLWVADASVIPTSPACNTMWPTMMFAARIGHIIQESRPETLLLSEQSQVGSKL